MAMESKHQKQDIKMKNNWEYSWSFVLCRELIKYIVLSKWWDTLVFYRNTESLTPKMKKNYSNLNLSYIIHPRLLCKYVIDTSPINWNS